LTIFALNSCEQDPEIINIDDLDKKLPKVDVCHYDAKTDTWKTLNINGNALKAHLAHGDLEGSLEDRLTYVPDDAFEYHLIYHGYDDVMDDYVFTRDIIDKEHLYLCEPGGCLDNVNAPNRIFDLTGIEDFKNLKMVTINEQHITSIDFSQNLKLERLNLFQNDNLINLNLSKNEMLKSIDIEDWGSLEILDLSKNPNLESVSLYCRQLKEINLKNGNNTLITSYEVYGNSFLTCVQVDDKIWSDNNWPNYEEGYVFSEDCGY
jgi:hypothetical protein